MPLIKSSVGSRKPGNRNAAVVDGTGAGSPSSKAEKKVCCILMLVLSLSDFIYLFNQTDKLLFNIIFVNC